MIMSDRKRVVILISGSGSNMEALAKAALAPDYPAKIMAVICDQPLASGIEKARALNLPVYVVPRRDYASKTEHEKAILAILAKYQPNFLCLAGYMRLLSAEFIAAYPNQIINIHPSLLPLFKGLDTHAQALVAGVKISGCTIHYVNEKMDEGKIISQAAVPVLLDDTPETLAARVLAVEHKLYPETLKALCLAPDRLVITEPPLCGSLLVI